MDRYLLPASAEALAYIAQAQASAQIAARMADHEVNVVAVELGPDAEPADVWLVASERMNPEQRTAFVLEACRARVRRIMDASTAYVSEWA